MVEKDGVIQPGVVQDDIPNSGGIVPKKGDVAEVARVLAWRKQHPEQYRKTQRELMRKRRAKTVSSATPDSES